jgi:hypothetical protein
MHDLLAKGSRPKQMLKHMEAGIKDEFKKKQNDKAKNRDPKGVLVENGDAGKNQSKYNELNSDGAERRNPGSGSKH